MTARRRDGTAATGRAPSRAIRAHRWGGLSTLLGGDLAPLLIAIPLILPFLRPGWFFGHDNMHLIRLFEQDVMIRAGQFPVRWYPDVAGGYGSPHPQYYAPLFYLLAQIFHLLGLPLGGAIKAAVAVVVAGASLAMYRLTREFFGRGAAIASAAAYSYAPYHILDLYVRTAFSELTVFVFLPLVVLGFWRLSLGATPARIAGAAAALGGLCLAHTITAMLVPPLLGGYLLLLAWRERLRLSFLLPAAGAALLGFGIASFFLVPLIAEKGAVETNIYAAAHFDYRKHFATIGQMIWSPWGFGLSREGTADWISFRLGFLQILGCAVAAIGWARLRAISAAAAHHAAFAAALAILGVLMATSISAPIWSLAPPLRYVQFPWRFLLLSSFGTAFLCGAAAPLPWAATPRPPKRDRADSRSAAGGGDPTSERVPLWAAWAIAAAFAAGSLGTFGFKERIPYEQIAFGGEAQTDMHRRDAKDAAREPTVFTREFVRRQTLHWFDHLPPGGYPYPPKEDLARPRAEIARGRATVSVIEETPVRLGVEVHAAEPSLLRLNIYRFPGWSLRVDRREVTPSAPDGKRPLLTVDVPPGSHEVEAIFRRTPPRWAGDLLSLASAVAVTGLAAAGLRRSRPTG